jgi:Cu/Ag efflux protein CusF
MKSSSFPVLALVLSSAALAAGPAAAQMQMTSGDGMQKKDGMQMEMGKEGIFEGQGTVVAIVSAKNQIVLKHGEIKGQMDAMTMGYALASPSLAQGLKPGDAVKFRIDGAKKEIVAIERLAK